MAGLALVLFLALFAFGQKIMGWSDPEGEVQIALFLSFLFGIISGYRANGG